MSTYLIIDQGGQSTRAILFSNQGEVLGSARRAISTQRSAAGFIEHCSEELLDSVRQVIGELLANFPPAGETLHAGLITQRSSLVCWNKTTSEALTPVISWQDTRGKSLLADFAKSADQIKAKTGLVVNAHYGASKIRWCLDNIPAVKSCHAAQELAVGPLAAFILFKLTGQFRIDPANASRTLLMNIHNLDWDDELLAMAGIERQSLPVIVNTRDDYGLFFCGNYRLPLRLINGDQSAAFNGYGQIREGIAYINAGSGAFVACLLNNNETPPPSLLLSPVYCEESCQFVCEGTVNGAANALEYFRQQLALADYHAIDQWAEHYPDIPICLNGIGGLGSPFWQPDFASAFIGQGNRQQKMLAVMESIAFLLTVNLREMKRAGITLDKIYLSGGLSLYKMLATRLAQLNDLPVFIHNDPQASARGAAFQLAGFPSHWQEPVMTVHSPSEGTRLDQGLMTRFEHWLQLMPSCA